jgi:hypothetical protein
MNQDLLVRLLDKVENRHYGKYRGFVEDNKDPENRGRLRLRIPSVLGKDVVSGWALPCAPYGGMADQGLFLIPEEKAGVWVEFEEGNLDYPVWVGTFWAKPGGTTEVPKPGDAQTPPTRKILKTRKGHTIELEDADGEEKIVINHTKNSFVSIDKDGSVVIGNHKGSTLVLNAKDENMVIVEQHGNSVRMTADGVTIVNKDGSAIVELGADLARIMAKNIILQGTSVAVGAGATDPPGEPAVLGQTFALMYNTHTHPTAVGPSGPPVPAPLPLGPAPAGQGLAAAVVVK